MIRHDEVRSPSDRDCDSDSSAGSSAELKQNRNGGERRRERSSKAVEGARDRVSIGTQYDRIM
jgi:hypothetical protein